MAETDQATKADIENLRRDLREFMLEREVAAIRWFVGIQVAYFATTVGGVYFMIAQLVPHLPK